MLRCFFLFFSFRKAIKHCRVGAAFDGLTLHTLGKLLAGHGLMLQQVGRHGLQLLPLFGQQLLAAVKGNAHDGLHFLVHLDTELDDETLRLRAAEAGLRLALLSDYYADPAAAPHHVLVVNYAGLELSKLPEALERLAKILEQ